MTGTTIKQRHGFSNTKVVAGFKLKDESGDLVNSLN